MRGERVNRQKPVRLQEESDAWCRVQTKLTEVDEECQTARGMQDERNEPAIMSDKLIGGCILLKMYGKNNDRGKEKARGGNDRKGEEVEGKERTGRMKRGKGKRENRCEEDREREKKQEDRKKQGKEEEKEREKEEMKKEKRREVLRDAAR
ncbi:octapeptide-repeat protein T2-like [Ambystoma mexicanum]|uniref:octapeptide-repeat protein T2-like n=1 Tax=Ambystoma mexicanum TaxID=8296 RepID=UPI0037E94430